MAQSQDKLGRRSRRFAADLTRQATAMRVEAESLRVARKVLHEEGFHIAASSLTERILELRFKSANLMQAAKRELEKVAAAEAEAKRLRGGV